MCVHCFGLPDDHVADPGYCDHYESREDVQATWQLPVSSWDNWPGDLLVIIPCSKGKLDHPAPAAELYTGPMFTMALRAARVLVPDEQIRVLSGKHGFVRLDKGLRPYDQRIDLPKRYQPGMTMHELRRQAEREGLLDHEFVLSLCSSAYSASVYGVWPRAGLALDGVGGIGKQRHELGQIAAMGHRLGAEAPA